MPWPKTGATQYYVVRTSRQGSFAYNNEDLWLLDLLTGLTLGCYQPSPWVLIVSFIFHSLKLACEIKVAGYN